MASRRPHITTSASTASIQRSGYHKGNGSNGATAGNNSSFSSASTMEVTKVNYGDAHTGSVVNNSTRNLVGTQRQIGIRNNHESRSPSEGTHEDEKECCGARSPLQWLCPDERASNGSIRRSFFQQRAATYNNHSHNHGGKSTPNDARNRAAQKLLKAESDEELEAELMNITYPDSNFNTTTLTNHGTTTNKNPMDSPASSLSHQSTLRINTQLPYIQIASNQEQLGLRPIQGEARIVAPNVSKLSPFSAVEVRLESSNETVAVLCSVDVLKMRSSFFHDILSDQEKSALSGANQSMTSTALQGSVLWRDPIVIAESSPFEAAAFLESLHEGRVLFRGEWNLCWARLSVSWGIEDLVQEYAAQITEHLNKLMTMIQTYHWRLNPTVLNGMRIAIFRKGSNTIPTVVTGMIVDSNAAIGYSKLRVAFENEKGFGKSASNVFPPSYGNTIQSPAFISVRSDNNFVNRYSYQPSHTIYQHDGEQNFTPISRFSSPTPFGNSPSVPSTEHLHGDQYHHQPIPSQTTQQSQVVQTVVGDVGEPFWVQSTKEGSIWTEPDDLFLLESKRFLTTTDKRIFWEMARAIIELPEISTACKCLIRNAVDLTALLKKPEYSVLWTMDGPDILPKDMSSEFVRFAYVMKYSANISSSTTNS